MWTLSGFIDEISPDFTEQCRVAAGLGLTHAEVRSAWDDDQFLFTGQQIVGCLVHPNHRFIVATDD